MSFAHAYALHVIITEKLIELAKLEDAKEKPDIRYFVSDATDLKEYYHYNCYNPC